MDAPRATDVPSGSTPEPKTIGNSDEEAKVKVVPLPGQTGAGEATGDEPLLKEKTAPDHGEDDPTAADHAEHPLVHGRVMKPYANSPKAACACGCCVQVFGVLLVMMLQGALGTDFINQSTDVALHIWSNEWFEASRVDDEGQKICNYDQTLDLEEGQRQQEVNRLTAGEKEYKLQVVYLSDSGNMLEVDKLRKMKELEDFIVSQPDYQNFCLRQPGTTRCQAPVSAMVACDVTQSMSTNCDALSAWPPGVVQCEGANAAACFQDRSMWSLTEEFMESKAAQFSTVQLGESVNAERILTPFEAAFGSGNAASGALLSEFWFGFPLPGFRDTGDNAEEQAEKIETFFEDAYLEKLDNFNQEEENAGFQIGYSGGGLAGLSIQALLMQDFMFVALAFVVVWIYVAFMKDSLFLATMALLQVFLCFIWGLLVYRIVFGSFFGTFHIMAIFLLVGIGVDGVFVMSDNFELAAAHDARMSEDLWARLSWMWKYSGNAITVTSVTTTVSFAMNATSTFYGIAAFGWFAAALIVCNYLSMLFFFPAVIAFNKVQFAEKKFLCGLPEFLSSCCRNTSPELQAENEQEKKEEKSVLVRFFENQFASFILHHRAKVLVLFFGASIFMFAQLPKMTPERGSPQLLKDDHPLSLYSDVMKERFVRGGSVFNTNVQVMFGFARNAISDDDADKSGEGYGDKDAIGSQGDVRWADTWYVEGSGQKVNNFPVVGEGFECVIQLCDSAERKDPSRNTGGPPSYNVKGCFPRDVYSFISSNPQPDITWEAAKADFATFNTLMDRMFAANTGEYAPESDLAEYTFAENINNQPVYRFFKFEVRLTSSIDMDADDGNDLADRWKAWLADEMGKGSCAATADTFWPMLNVPDFHQFKVQENLINEMYSGIIIAIFIALIVLNIATGNFFVGLYAAGSIGMIVVWVMAIVPLQGWELGIVENIALVMVPGLSVDYVAHMAESYIHAKFDEREHRVIAMLEHSGVSVISGSISTVLAGTCLLMCEIVFFPKFGTILICTIAFSLLWALFFFPSLLALIGPVGIQGDWHRIIHPCLQPAMDAHEAHLRGGKILCTQKSQDVAMEKETAGGRTFSCAIL